MSIVWDSDRGRMCPECGEAIDRCRCSEDGGDAGDGVVRLRLEKAGRKGKSVTVVTGLPQGGVRAVLKALKKRCGTGGTVKDGAVELQGDHRETVREELRRREFEVRG